MTDAPEPAELAAPDLPRDPAQYAARRPRLPLSFWLMIAFGLVCVLAGVAVGRFGARLFPVKPAAESAAPAQTAAADSAPGSLYAPPPLAATPPGAPVTAATATSPAPAAVSALNSRIDQLVQNQRRSASAAGAALAAAELGEAAQSSRPFADQLAALDPILPDSSALRGLAAPGRPADPQPRRPGRRFRGGGRPRRRRLPRAAQGLGPDQATAAPRLTAVLTIRRVDKLTGDSPDAVLARAQRQVDDGDLEDALTTLNDLPPAGREAIAAWRVRAARRVEIDRLIAAIRQGAAQDLAEASGHG